MKLIYCPDCQDVRKLGFKHTTCECGASFGRYFENGIDAEIGGKAIPMGIVNSSFRKALENRPQKGMGVEFIAFVIPVYCDTIRKPHYVWLNQ